MNEWMREGFNSAVSNVIIILKNICVWVCACVLIRIWMGWNFHESLHRQGISFGQEGAYIKHIGILTI